jgi:hypothetical protein
MATTLPRDLMARHNPATLPADADRHWLHADRYPPDGFHCRVGYPDSYSPTPRLHAHVSYTLADDAAATAGEAAARALADTLAAEARAEAANSPEADAFRRADAEWRAAAEEQEAHEARVAELRAEYEAKMAARESPAEVAAEMVAAEARSLGEFVESLRQRRNQAHAELSEVVRRHWRAAAGRQQAEIKAERAALEDRARAFVEKLAADLAAIHQTEQLLDGPMPDAA